MKKLLLISIIVILILLLYRNRENFTSDWVQYMKDINMGKIRHYGSALPGTNMSPIGRGPEPWVHVGRVYSKSQADDRQLILESRRHYAKRNAYEYRVVNPMTGMPVRLHIKKPELLGREEIKIPGFAGKFIVEIESRKPYYNPYV